VRQRLLDAGRWLLFALILLAVTVLAVCSWDAELVGR